MNLIKCLLLLLFFTACESKLTSEKKNHIRKTTTKISCFTPDGWVDYYPQHPDAFWRGGWIFYNLEGEKIESSMCQRKRKQR
tara:strand:- start:2 stop:247 length:246 start_codon:yes stop_codon:yes gene_type:complete